MNRDLANMREDYRFGALTLEDMDVLPMQQFKRWLQEAISEQLPEPNAMFLATVQADGQPAVRTVLLKGLDETRMHFYTNHESDKARQLAQNPRAALLFFWQELQRQVRLEGRVEKMSAAASLAYFRMRPRDSQIGAWASPQSSVIADRRVLEQRVADIERQFEGEKDIPLPPHWGGYYFIPHLYEFWQGRSNRLHDRIRYRPKEDGWILERLAP